MLAFDKANRNQTALNKDLATLEAIGEIYCASHHHNVPKDHSGLCESCRETINHTLERTASCPFEHEGNCQDCAIHCQRGEAQERIRSMMSYAAPRMTFRHPIMTIEYLRKKVRTSKHGE